MILKKWNIEIIVPDESEHTYNQLINEGYKIVEAKPPQTTDNNKDLKILTVDQLKLLADEKKIEYDSKIKKEDLIKLLEGAV